MFDEVQPVASQWKLSCCPLDLCVFFLSLLILFSKPFGVTGMQMIYHRLSCIVDEIIGRTAQGPPARRESLSILNICSRASDLLKTHNDWSQSRSDLKII